MATRSIVLALCALVIGCGRVGFDAAGDGGQATDAMFDATADAIAIPTCAADGLCAAMCMPMDPDCVSVCGDGTCTGNGGELCATCMADCATRTPVCGNGACDPGEDIALCYADCGPMPWPSAWTNEESTLLTMINARRTGGFACPGGPGVVTAPALGFEPSYLPAAREWAWEIAHQNYRTMNGDMCNGRTWAERNAASDYNGFLHAFGAGATPASALSAWSTNAGACAIMMDPNLTRIAVAGAHELEEVFVLLFK